MPVRFSSVPTRSWPAESINSLRYIAIGIDRGQRIVRRDSPIGVFAHVVAKFQRRFVKSTFGAARASTHSTIISRTLSRLLLNWIFFHFKLTSTSEILNSSERNINYFGDKPPAGWSSLGPVICCGAFPYPRSTNQLAASMRKA
jgi:hypothetical protein